MNGDAGDRKRGEVGRGERIQTARGHLDGSIPSVQFVIEEDRHFRDGVIAGDDDGGDEVVPAVAPRLEQRDLERGRGRG